jgi:hypothetical protein
MIVPLSMSRACWSRCAFALLVMAACGGDVGIGQLHRVRLDPNLGAPVIEN